MFFSSMLKAQFNKGPNGHHAVNLLACVVTGQTSIDFWYFFSSQTDHKLLHFSQGPSHNII
jgi:hypothetical protein